MSQHCKVQCMIRHSHRCDNVSAFVFLLHSLGLSHLLTANCELIAVIEGSVFLTDKVDIKQDVLFSNLLKLQLWGPNFSSSIWKFCIKNVWNSSVVHSLERAYNRWLLAFHVLLLIYSKARAQKAWVRPMEELLTQKQWLLSWYPKEWRANMLWYQFDNRCCQNRASQCTELYDGVQAMLWFLSHPLGPSHWI